ncbi:MAG: hypothetical protein EOP49_11935 [Sphingobacteriales bacterium]|nr:MAG: hypothetical protein EOP49_11935 [Sphingobacteriales bacterium]
MFCRVSYLPACFFFLLTNFPHTNFHDANFHHANFHHALQKHHSSRPPNR